MRESGTDGGQMQEGFPRINDAELLILADLLVIAKALKCGVSDLYPSKPADLDRVVRQGSR